MFDFDPDEGFFTFISAIATLAGGYRFYSALAKAPATRGGSGGAKVLLWLLPPICAVLVLQFVNQWADSQVRGHPDYTLLFLLGGGAWLFLGVEIAAILGVSLRRDVVERNNPAASVAVAGMMIAVSIVYAAANVGGGPTIWTTLLPAAVGSIALALLWCLVLLIGSTLADDITIDRDIASGVRLAGALIGCALILGRAAGGNWVSWNQTWADMLQFGWPAILIVLSAGIVHRVLRPTPSRLHMPVQSGGFRWAFVFILIGFAGVALTPHGFNPSKW